MSIESFLSKLEKVKRRGQGKWLAQCPCHYDKSPSLAISEPEAGLILMHCFGCGASGNDVANAIGVDASELFPPRDHDSVSYKAQKKYSISPDLAIEALQTESLVVLMIAKDMQEKGSIDKDTRDRLLLAVSRIETLTVIHRM